MSGTLEVSIRTEPAVVYGVRLAYMSAHNSEVVYRMDGRREWVAWYSCSRCKWESAQDPTVSEHAVAAAYHAVHCTAPKPMESDPTARPS